MQEQQEFLFVRDLEYKAHISEEQVEGDEVISEDALEEFSELMAKYDINEEDQKRIAFLAKWF